MAKYIITNREQDFLAIGWSSFASISDCILDISLAQEVQVDTETTSLSFMDGKMFSLQLGNDTNQYIVDLETVDITEFKGLLESKLLIFQNALFDLPFLYAQDIIAAQVYDTLLAERCLSLGILKYRRDLASLAKRYLNVDMDKGMQKSIAEVGILDLEAIEYAFSDVVHLSAIKKLQIRKAKKHGMIKHINLENRFVRVLAYVEFCGIFFDAKKWMDIARENEYYEFGAMLEVKEYIKENLGIDADEEDLNIDSNQQMLEIFKKLGINTYNKKEKKHSLESKFIEKQDHPFVDLYLDYKRKSKKVSTYGRNWFSVPFQDGRIHTKFKQLTRASRMSCGDTRKDKRFVNIQNIPRVKKMRESFKGERQNVLITADYSGQESVIMADKSKEPKLLEFFRNGGGDMHSYVAQQIWKDKLGGLELSEIKENYPELRQKSKSANFAISFGGTGYTIADNLNIPREEGDRVFEQFMSTFTGLSKYFDETARQALERGYILINELTGGRRFIEDMKYYRKGGSDDPKFESKVYRLSLNTPVQATAAMITKTAGIMFFDWILENKRFGKTKIVNIVHDEYVVEENSRKAEDTAKVLKKCMEDAGDLFLDELKLYAEPKISKVWQK